MKVNAEMMFLGIEQGQTKDGKNYARCGLLQGINSEVLFLKDEMKKEIESKNIKPLSKVNVVLDISIGEKTYVNLLSIDEIK